MLFDKVQIKNYSKQMMPNFYTPEAHHYMKIKKPSIHFIIKNVFDGNYSFSIKNIFYDKMDLGFFIFVGQYSRTL